MKSFAHILFLTLFLVLTSCGKDKLNSKIESSNSNLSASCSGTFTHSPVCGSDGKDYDNASFAQCAGQTVAHVGHCDCTRNTGLVCGSDGQDHTECEALAPNSGITIVKFVPCASAEQ